MKLIGGGVGRKVLARDLGKSIHVAISVVVSSFISPPEYMCRV